MNIRTALRQAAKQLEQGGISAPRLTAEVLLAHALGRERSWLYGHPEEEIGGTDYERYLEERLQGKPLQYITGHQEFYGREFQVTPAAFIPRPETEHVVEAALRLAPRDAPLVDVGTGSGAIAVTLSLELRRGVLATDSSVAALAVAAANARRLGACVQFIAGDLVSALASDSVGAVVSNPPYVPTTEAPGLQREVRDYEPSEALYAGPEGLDTYRRLVADAERVLRPGGWLIGELGYRQVDAVRAMLGPRWGNIEIVADLAGLPRVLVGQALGGRGSDQSREG